MEHKELFTIADFLNLYSISRSTFYREVKGGRLRILKRGRSTRISRKDAENWVEKLRRDGDAV